MKLDFNEVKGVIFDVDGTLLDSMNTWFTVGVRYLKTLGIDADESLGLILFSMTMTEAAEYMIEHFDLMDNELFREKIVSRALKTVGQDGIAEFFGEEMSISMQDFYANDVMPRKGAVELLNIFESKGIPMSIATSTHIDLLEPALERLDLSKYFKTIISASALKISKSTEEPFARCIDAMNLRKGSDIWVFEDGLYAIKTAKDIGLSTVGVYDEISHDDWNEIKEISDISVMELDELM